MSIFSKFLLILILLFGVSNFAKADPVRIISGTSSTSTASFDFQTNNSSFQGNQSSGLSTQLYEQTFLLGSSFTPVVNLFSSNGTNTGFPNSFIGNALINGFQYNTVRFGGDYGISSLVFTSAQPVQFPNNPLTTFSVQIPFEMQGVLRGSICPNTNCSSIPETMLYGSGNATYYFYENTNGKFAFSKAEYVFSTPEPTPEPATILLLGTGLAGIFGYARRRRKIKS